MAANQFLCIFVFSVTAKDFPHGVLVHGKSFDINDVYVAQNPVKMKIRMSFFAQSLSSSAEVLPVAGLTRCCPPHARQFTSSPHSFRSNSAMSKYCGLFLGTAVS